MTTKKESPAEPKNVKFEDALKRLEKIVEKLETGDVPLDESLSLYEEGIALYRHCSSKLEEAKKKVEILTRKGTGKESEKMRAVPFDPEKFNGTNDETGSDSTESDETPF